MVVDEVAAGAVADGVEIGVAGGREGTGTTGIDCGGYLTPLTTR